MRLHPVYPCISALKSFSHKNAPWSYSGSQSTVGFQELKEKSAWPSLGVNNCNPCPPPLTRRPKPCSETVKDVNGERPLETTTRLQTQSTVWQDMSRSLYSDYEQDTSLKRFVIMDSALCDCKEAEQTVHHILQDCSNWRQQRHHLWQQN